MIALDLPLLAVGTILTVLLFTFGVRRLLGLRLATLRTLAAGLIAFAVASPIITTIGRSAVTSKKPAAFPAVLFVILGAAIALLVGMVALVIAEAVLLLGLHGGPSITRTVTLYTFFGYCLLVIAAIFAVRVLVLVFHQDAR